MSHHVIVIVTMVALYPAGVLAQPAPASAVTISYEVSRDRFHYHFKNPSSFDTTELVPHDFTQTYWGDNQWGVVTARYRLGGRVMESEVAATPQRSTRGDDFDSFFQTSGDVIVSGTTGRVSLRSWRARHTIALGPTAGFTWRVGYQYRRDRSLFHTRQTKIVSHTQPPSTDTFAIEGRETTRSDVHEIRFGVSRQWTPAGAWRVGAGVDVAPTTRARLTTVLPDKYPGREIVFSAIVLTFTSAVTVTHGTRWPISGSVGTTQSFSYLQSRQFRRRAMTLAISAGWEFKS